MRSILAKTTKLKNVLSKVLMNLKPAPSNLEVAIYQVFSKNELKGLCNKYKRLRFLTDGNVCYAWDAQEFDHFTILNHLKMFGRDISKLKRFNFENGKIELSIPEGEEQEVLEKFKKNFGVD